MSPLYLARCALGFVLLASLLCGCGNKGDLVKPTPKTAEKPAAPATAAPPQPAAH